MSLHYTVVFFIMDLTNFAFSYCQKNYTQSVVDTQDQIIALLVNCFVCGGVYGLVFASIDVNLGDFSQREAFLHGAGICYGIGLTGGVIGGFCNEVLGSYMGKIDMIFDEGVDPFGEEI